MIRVRVGSLGTLCLFLLVMAAFDFVAVLLGDLHGSLTGRGLSVVLARVRFGNWDECACSGYA